MKLTAKHERILEAYVYDGVMDTRERFAKRMGVTRQLIWRLLREPEATRIIRELTDERLGLERPAIQGAIVREARAGNVSALRLASQLLGDISGDGVNVITNVTQTTEPLEDRTADVLDRRAAVLAKNER